VRVEILGERLRDIFVIPRTALRDGETVWLLKPDMTLDIRSVVPVWRDKETVVVTNALQTGDRLIVSDIAGPVAGMLLRLPSKGPQPTGKNRKKS
jgi:hypothetical protein